MRNLLTFIGLLGLAGCSTLASLAGYVPVEQVDGGPPATVVPSGVGVEACTSIAGAVSLLSAIGLNVYRNYTRTKAIKRVGSVAPQGGGTTVQV